MAQPRSLRRPLSSSPLTGPFLTGDGSIVRQDTPKDRPKPSRISSTPELSSLVKATPGTSVVQYRKNSSPAAFNCPTSPPTLPPAGSAPPIRPPRSALRRQTVDIATSLNNVIRTSTLRPNSAPTAASEWLTFNTYADVPRFSRTGITSPNVVLPVTAKEHKRCRSATLQSQPSPQRLKHQRSLPMLLQNIPNHQKPAERTSQKSPPEGTVVSKTLHHRRNHSLAPLSIRTQRLRSRRSLPSLSPRKDVPEQFIPDNEKSRQNANHNVVVRSRRSKESFVVDRQSLFSVPGSPSELLEMEFDMIPEEGEDTALLVASPTSNRVRAYGLQPIIIPSFPVDIDSETPLSPIYGNRISVRHLRDKSFTHSVKRKPSLKQRKSLASVKAHKRAVSKADSILAPTTPVEPYTKGSSFPFLLSSDGAEGEFAEEQVPEGEELSDGEASYRRSLDDTSSIDSVDLRDAEELLIDILALPTRRSPTSELKLFPAPPQSTDRVGAFSIGPAPTYGLPSPPSSPSSLASSTPASSSPTPSSRPTSLALPSSSTSITDTVSTSPLPRRPSTTSRTSLPASAARRPSDAASSIGSDDIDTESLQSATTLTVSSRRVGSKALELLGIEDDGGSSSDMEDEGLMRPRLVKRPSNLKALEMLGIDIDDNGAIRTLPSPTTPTLDKSREGTRKQGGMKKLWKTLTRGSAKVGVV